VFQAAVLCVFPSLSGTAAFALGSLLIGFNYGACLSVFPSITADYYGLKNLGLNYGLVFTAWGVGGLILPTYVAGTIKVATGYYTLAFYAAAVLMVVSAAMTFIVKPPTPKISGIKPLVDVPPISNRKPSAKKA
jgi:OFA family oxalate/formate antiporter-like MFS transporter